MNGHDVELDQLRAGVSCAALLERLQPGWLLDKEGSTPKCLKYRRGAGEVLIINHGGRGWWDPMSDAKGDVFSLTQHLDPALNFGQVRKLLRGMVGMRLSCPTLERRPAKPDKPAVPVAQLWARRRRLSCGSATWGYLTGERALPAAVLQAADLFDAVREGPHGSAWFAHRDGAGVLTGIDMRGPDWRVFFQAVGQEPVPAAGRHGPAHPACGVRGADRRAQRQTFCVSASSSRSAMNTKWLTIRASRRLTRGTARRPRETPGLQLCSKG